MGKCKNVSNGYHDDYPCPNNEFAGSGYCLLHSPDENRTAAEQPRVQYIQDLSTFLAQELPELVFQDINFPRDIAVNFEKAKASIVIFKKCAIRQNLTFPSSSQFRKLYFETCQFQRPLSLKDLEISDLLEFKDVEFPDKLVLSDLKGNFMLNAHIRLLNSIDINDVHFKNGIILNIESCGGQFNMSKVRITSESEINIDRFTGMANLDSVSFEQLTVLRVGSFGQHRKGEIKITNCAIDCLYLKDIEWTNGEQYVEILNPKKIKPTIQSFKSFRKMSKATTHEIESLAIFSRNAKQYFATQKAQYRELYDHYFILDQYFSRFLPDNKGLKWFVNVCYEKFSFYGYSLSRPLCWFAVFFILFSGFYILRDYSLKPSEFGWSKIGSSLVNHLGQISFFRGSNRYFADDWKKLAFILEGAILIPIFTFIVIGIRKVFKRA